MASAPATAAGIPVETTIAPEVPIITDEPGPTNTGADQDELVGFQGEMPMKLYTHDFHLANIVWNTSDTAGKVIFTKRLSPFEMFSQCKYMMRLYNEWRGGFVFTVSIAGTGFQGGRLMATWLPPNYIGEESAFTKEFLTTFSSNMFDVKSQESMSFVCQDQLQVGFHYATPYPKKDLMGYINSYGGLFVLWVSLPLVAAQGNLTSVNLWVRCRLAQDFKVGQMIVAGSDVSPQTAFSELVEPYIQPIGQILISGERVTKARVRSANDFYIWNWGAHFTSKDCTPYNNDNKSCVLPNIAKGLKVNEVTISGQKTMVVSVLLSGDVLKGDFKPGGMVVGRALKDLTPGVGKKFVNLQVANIKVGAQKVDGKASYATLMYLQGNASCYLATWASWFPKGEVAVESPDIDWVFPGDCPVSFSGFSLCGGPMSWGGVFKDPRHSFQTLYNEAPLEFGNESYPENSKNFWMQQTAGMRQMLFNVVNNHTTFFRDNRYVLCELLDKITGGVRAYLRLDLQNGHFTTNAKKGLEFELKLFKMRAVRSMQPTEHLPATPSVSEWQEREFQLQQVARRQEALEEQLRLLHFGEPEPVYDEVPLLQEDMEVDHEDHFDVYGNL